MTYSYVARQPILNVNRVTLGYELLFRDSEANLFPAHVNSDRATYRLLAENFLVMGKNPNLDYSRCFINFPYKSLINRLPLMLPKRSVVIEILETCEPDDKLYEAVQELYRNGYLLALDDFIYAQEWQRFLPYIHIVKLDIADLGLEPACQFVQMEKKDGSKAKFLAERVETEEEFVRCREAGFEFFQGYFFRKPMLERQKYIGPEQVTAMRLLKEVSRQEVDFARVEQLISTDATLSYRLLSFVNSLSERTQVVINSFRQALIYLGEVKIKMFVSLTIASYISTKKPRELFSLSLQRARFCQLMEHYQPFNIHQHQLFMIGLFSVMDALMDVHMEELIKELPISDEYKLAIIHREGELGDLLNLHEAFEDGDWFKIEEYCDKYQLSLDSVTELYRQAQCWSQDIHRNTQ